jgi:hypothetical protein
MITVWLVTTALSGTIFREAMLLFTLGEGSSFGACALAAVVAVPLWELPPCADCGRWANTAFESTNAKLAMVMVFFILIRFKGCRNKYLQCER